MTDQADLRALSDAATPGPWYFEDERDGALLMPRFGSSGHLRGVGDYAFGTVDGGVGEDQAPTGADLAYIVALVNWHRETLRAATPVVPESRTVFTFPDGTVGPGDWDRATGQVVPAAASPSPDTACVHGADCVECQMDRKEPLT